jgi:hypothetical protein
MKMSVAAIRVDRVSMSRVWRSEIRSIDSAIVTELNLALKQLALAVTMKWGGTLAGGESGKRKVVSDKIEERRAYRLPLTAIR